MPVHQFIVTSSDLDSNLVISTGRVKVLTIHLSNKNLSQTAFVTVEDKDATELFHVAVPPADSRSVTYSEPTDFENGLSICALPTNGDLVRVSVAHSRTL